MHDSSCIHYILENIIWLGKGPQRVHMPCTSGVLHSISNCPISPTLGPLNGLAMLKLLSELSLQLDTPPIGGHLTILKGSAVQLFFWLLERTCIGCSCCSISSKSYMKQLKYDNTEGEYRCHLTILKGHAGQPLFVVVGRDATLHFCGCGMLLAM